MTAAPSGFNCAELTGTVVSSSARLFLPRRRNLIGQISGACGLSKLPYRRVAVIPPFVRIVVFGFSDRLRTPVRRRLVPFQPSDIDIPAILTTAVTTNDGSSLFLATSSTRVIASRQSVFFVTSISRRLHSTSVCVSAVTFIPVSPSFLFSSPFSRVALIFYFSSFSPIRL